MAPLSVYSLVSPEKETPLGLSSLSLFFPQPFLFPCYALIPLFFPESSFPNPLLALSLLTNLCPNIVLRPRALSKLLQKA